MPKLDFFQLSRPDLPTETKTFVEPRYKSDRSKDITLTLRALDAVTGGEVQQVAQEMVTKYCGNATLDIVPECEFPRLAGGGPEITLNDTIAYQAASLTVMQTASEKKDRYEFEEFVVMAVTCPVVWKLVLQWRTDLNRMGDKQAGNSEPAASTIDT